MGQWRNNSSRGHKQCILRLLSPVGVWRSTLLLPVEIQELLAMRFIAECFRSAGARDRKSSGNVAKFQAVFDLRSPNILVNKSGIKTVAGADSVDEGASDWRSRKNIVPTLG